MKNPCNLSSYLYTENCQWRINKAVRQKNGEFLVQPSLPITGTFYNNKTFNAVHYRETAYYKTLTDKCGKFLCFNSACFLGITCQLTIFVWKCSFSLHISFLLVSSQLLIRFTILVRSSLISRKCSSSCVILILEKHEDRTEITKIARHMDCLFINCHKPIHS